SDTGSSSDLIVWSLSRTETLGTSQAVQLRHRILQVRTYAIPPRQNQKVGDFPQGQCVNDTEMDTPFGKGCWQYYFEPKDEPPHDMVEGSPDALDSRIMTNWYQDGTLFGALDTAVRFASPGSTDEKAGIEWFVVHASVSHGKLHTALRNQGVVAVADNNVSFPDIAVTGSGQGVMGMSLMGDDYYPSAAWTKFDRSGPGTVHVVARGAGPYDGFGAYP